MASYTVSFTIEIEEGDADSPLEAALQLASTLSDPQVPERGVYRVVGDDGTDVLIDLDLPENDGGAFF